MVKRKRSIDKFKLPYLDKYLKSVNKELKKYNKILGINKDQVGGASASTEYEYLKYYTYEDLEEIKLNGTIEIFINIELNRYTNCWSLSSEVIDEYNKLNGDLLFTPVFNSSNRASPSPSPSPSPNYKNFKDYYLKKIFGNDNELKLIHYKIYFLKCLIKKKKK